MLLANPFTGVVINANPEGCNQYTGPNCNPSQFYKPFMIGEEQDEEGRDLYIYEGPFDSAEDAMYHERQVVGDDLYDLPPDQDRLDFLIRKATGDYLTAKEGKYINEDAASFPKRVYSVTPPRRVPKHRIDQKRQRPGQ